MDLPALDCHAHVSVSVTKRQLAELGQSVVFAVTREPDEAVEATRRYDPHVIWGCGAHPSYVAKGGSVSLSQMSRRVQRFALVGEIGLDRRSGNMALQQQTFDGILDCIATEPVLASIHSAGCSAEVLESIRRRPHPGYILHWFTGSDDQARELIQLGCYFSVNTAMQPRLLDILPIDRVLPETDFPVGQRRTGARPGDTSLIEVTLAKHHGESPARMRGQFYRNLRRVSVASGAIDRMQDTIVDLIMHA